MFHHLFLFCVGVGGIKRYWRRLLAALQRFDADQWDEEAEAALNAVLEEQLPVHVTDQLHVERGSKMFE